MKIGHLTFYRNYNYGSILQCYALQQFFLSKGIEIEAIVPKSDLSWKINSIIRKVSFVFSCLRYPEQYKCYKKFQEESQRSCLSLELNTRDKMDRFVEENIREREASFSELKNSLNKEYSCYIAGSDQVWSVAGPSLNPFFFLRFSPNNKKYSYAASMGADSLPAWHKKQLYRYVSKFAGVSIREITALDFFKDTDKIVPHVNMDPALLQDKYFWKNEEIIPDYLQNGNYLLLYFLNEPTDFALDHIKNIVRNKPNLKLYSFPYVFPKVDEELHNVTHISLSPREFLGAIDNSSLLCTDSFHGVIFALNFGVKFFNYRRAYKTISQNGRLNSLFERYRLFGATPTDVNTLTPVHYDIDKLLAEDRKESTSYLEKIIESIK